MKPIEFGKFPCCYPVFTTEVSLIWYDIPSLIIIPEVWILQTTKKGNLLGHALSKELKYFDGYYASHRFDVATGMLIEKMY